MDGGGVVRQDAGAEGVLDLPGYEGQVREGGDDDRRRRASANEPPEARGAEGGEPHQPEPDAPPVERRVQAGVGVDEQEVPRTLTAPRGARVEDGRGEHAEEPDRSGVRTRDRDGEMTLGKGNLTAIFVGPIGGGPGSLKPITPWQSMADKIDCSPDGSRIVFSKPQFGPTRSANVHVINADGTGLRQLTNPKRRQRQQRRELVVARRPQDLVRQQPRRRVPDLHDERRRLRRQEAH